MYLLDGFTANNPEDGCCAEGPGYWGGAAGSLFDSLELLDDMSGGKITVWHEPIIRNLCEFIATMNINGEFYVNYEDCHPMFTPDGNMIYRMGKKLGSQPLVDFGLLASVNRSAPYHYFAFIYRTFKNASFPVIKEAPRVSAKLGTWLEGHKIAVFREFPDTSRGLFLSTKGGNNSEPGNHNDMGCLVIAKNGKMSLTLAHFEPYQTHSFLEISYIFAFWRLPVSRNIPHSVISLRA
jgi:hypothetical protein